MESSSSDGKELSTIVETEITVKGGREFADLLLMLDSWTAAYIRVLDEEGCDWSSPHEFLQEFFEHMLFYIARLRETGHATPDRMIAIGEKLVESVQGIVTKCEQEEDLMRLVGRWTDKEQDIKDYWKDKELNRSLLCHL